MTASLCHEVRSLPAQTLSARLATGISLRRRHAYSGGGLRHGGHLNTRLDFSDHSDTM